MFHVLFPRPQDELLSSISSVCSSESMSQQLIYSELLRALYLGEKWDEAKTILLDMHEKVTEWLYVHVLTV